MWCCGRLGLCLGFLTRMNWMSVRDNRQAGEGGKGGEVVRPAVSERDRGWLERIPGAYCLVDKQGRLRLWNSRLEELTGCSAEHIGRMQARGFFGKAGDCRAVRAARWRWG